MKSNYTKLEDNVLKKQLVGMGYTHKEIPAEIKRMRREDNNSVNQLVRVY